MHVSYNEYILVLSCVFFALANYVDGAIGIVVSIVLIVGAKAPNATALLVWMILACLQCIAMICMAIYGLVVGAAVGVAVATSDDLKPLDPDAKAVLGKFFIMSMKFDKNISD